MKHPTLVGVLGPSPQSFDGVLSGLVRAHRFLDADDEQRGHDSAAVNRERDARLRDLSELQEWLRPAVEREKAMWDYQDRLDAVVKGETVLATVEPFSSFRDDAS